MGSLSRLIDGLDGDGRGRLDNAARRMRALTGFDRVRLSLGDSSAESSRGTFAPVTLTEDPADLPAIIADTAEFPVALFPRAEGKSLRGALLRSPAPGQIGELRAQGIGNMLCGVIGVLPMTGVIVRSSANVEAGGVSSEKLDHVDGAVKLIGGNAVLAVGEQPHGDQPLVEAERGVFHDGADLHGELPLRVLLFALPNETGLREVDVLASASGALHDAIGPTELDHLREAVFGIPEINHGLLESFGRSHGCL